MQGQCGRHSLRLWHEVRPMEADRAAAKFRDCEDSPARATKIRRLPGIGYRVGNFTKNGPKRAIHTTDIAPDGVWKSKLAFYSARPSGTRQRRISISNHPR